MIQKILALMIKMNCCLPVAQALCSCRPLVLQTVSTSKHSRFRCPAVVVFLHAPQFWGADLMHSYSLWVIINQTSTDLLNQLELIEKAHAHGQPNSLLTSTTNTLRALILVSQPFAGYTSDSPSALSHMSVVECLSSSHPSEPITP
jgi:hypothetical protein